jgi:hypothetical protein
MQQPSTRTAVVTKWPQLLAIHIQRYSMRNHLAEKDFTLVACPKELRIRGKLLTLVGLCEHAGNSVTEGHYVANVLIGLLIFII